MRARKPKSRSASGRSRAAIVPNPNLPKHERPRPKDGPLPVEIRVAHIGLIGGLLAALIAAVVGAIIAGYFAISNTDRQAFNQSQQSKTEFLRTQRQTVYATFIKDMTSVSDDCSALVNALSQDPATKRRDIAAVVRTANQHYLQLQNDETTIFVVGSNAMYNTVMNAVDTEYLAVYTDLINRADNMATTGKRDPKADEAVMHYMDNGGSDIISNALDSVSRQAKIDLGNN